MGPYLKEHVRNNRLYVREKGGLGKVLRNNTNIHETGLESNMMSSMRFYHHRGTPLPKGSM